MRGFRLRVEGLHSYGVSGTEFQGLGADMEWIPASCVKVTVPTTGSRTGVALPTPNRPPANNAEMENSLVTLARPCECVWVVEEG